MEKNFINIIMFFVLMLSIGVFFTMGLILGLNLSDKSRYQIENVNGAVILLDKYTGLTWKNANFYSNVLNDWQEMKIVVDDVNNSNVSKSKEQVRKNSVKQTETSQLKELNKLIGDKRISYKEFAKTIKTKYPVYSDMSDKELVEKILYKYPKLKTKIELD